MPFDLDSESQYPCGFRELVPFHLSQKPAALPMRPAGFLFAFVCVHPLTSTFFGAVPEPNGSKTETKWL